MYRSNDYDDLDARSGLRSDASDAGEIVQRRRGGLVIDDSHDDCLAAKLDHKHRREAVYVDDLDLDYLKLENLGSEDEMKVKDNPVQESIDDKAEFSEVQSVQHLESVQELMPEKTEENTREETNLMVFTTNRDPMAIDEASLLQQNKRAVDIEKKSPRNFLKYLRTKKSEKAGLIYGHDLNKVAKSHRNKNVPILVEIICDKIETSIKTEGIYRTPGSESEKDELIKQFSEVMEDPKYIEDKIKESDIHALTSLVKKFFLDLKPSLISLEICEEIFDIVHNKDGLDSNATTRISIILREKLLKINYETFAFFVRHLAKVAEERDENKMNSNNLSIMVGLSLIGGEPRADFHCVWEKIIDHHEAIFKDNSAAEAGYVSRDKYA